MNKGWQTKADVLKDLSKMNGRRTGAEHLDWHVVQGERPPPILHETPDEDEMSYFSGGHAVQAAADGVGPDLAGISTMLKMVNDLDETLDNNQPITLYHNRVTDEINISKLNPNAGVYVPGGIYNTKNIPKHSPKKTNHRHKSPRSLRTPVKENNVVDNSMKNSLNGKDVLPKFSNINMFKSKSDKNIQERDMNNDKEESHVSNKPSKPNTQNIQERDMNNDKEESHMLNKPSNPNAQNIQQRDMNSDKEESHMSNKPSNPNTQNIQQRDMNSDKEESHMSNKPSKPNTQNMQPEAIHKEPVNALTTKPNLLANGLPKRQIDTRTTHSPKADEIKKIQEKIKSTIITSSRDSSLNTKRQKNVAIATLLKLGMAPQNEKPVKLVKPEYFEKPPTNEDIKDIPEDKVEKEVPSMSSSESNVNCIDQDSISKVNGWFSSMESPKRKPQLQEPLVLKDCITFKKKTSSSITSRNSTTSKEKEEPKDKETKSFKPSAYASDLLKKYETNAQKQAPLIEDLGTRLERQLKERDEIIKQKIQARENAG